MAQITIIPEFVTSIHGSLSKDSNYYYRTNRNGHITLCRKPRRPDRKPSQQQLSNRTKFRQTNATTKAVLSNAVLKAYFTQLWVPQRKHYSTLQGFLMHLFINL